MELNFDTGPKRGPMQGPFSCMCYFSFATFETNLQLIRTDLTFLLLKELIVFVLNTSAKPRTQIW